MKLALFLLVLLPLALATSVEKRGILEFLGLGHLVDFGQLKVIVQGILNKVGSDANEQNCESACHETLSVDESHLFHTLCTPLCRS
ncbi:hypothetical protein ACOMHN_008628 [Nucella lapillus]